MGQKGQYLVEVNTQIREQLHHLKQEKQKQDQSIETYEIEIQRQNDQIKVLTTALEIKAEDFGLEGEFRTSLLYDVGHSRQELLKVKEDY